MRSRSNKKGDEEKLLGNFMMLNFLTDFFQNAFTKIFEYIIGPLIGITIDAVSEIISVIAPKIILLITGAIKTVKTAAMIDVVKNLAVLIFDVAVMLIDAIFESTGLKRSMAEGIVTKTFDMYKTMITSSNLDCLSWTPINYIFSGDSNLVVKDSVSNPYYLSIKLMNEAIKPTALIVLALIVMVELFQITVRTEGMRNSGFESPFKLMLKVAICKIVLDNTEFILRAIFEMGTDVVLRIGTIASRIDVQPPQETLNYFVDIVMKTNFIMIFILNIQVQLQSGLVWLIMKIGLRFMILARIIEIYMMMVFAPIPFATFAHQEFSSVGKSYIKQFVGVSFRAAVMFVIILIYGSLMTIATVDFTNVQILKSAFQIVEYLVAFGLYPAAIGAFFVLFLVKPLIYSLMLFFALQTADTYTRKITGAWY